MKKHNDGYTLVLVLVVMVVLCLLTTYVLTFSLRNLNTQKNAAVREQNHYAAVGEVEAVIGSIQAFAEKNQGAAMTAVFVPKESVEESYFLLTTSEEFQKKETEQTEENWVTVFGVEEVKLVLDEEKPGSLRLSLVSVCGSTQIDCTLRFAASASKNLLKDNCYDLTGLTGVEYISYTISMVKEVTTDE